MTFLKNSFHRLKRIFKIVFSFKHCCFFKGSISKRKLVKLSSFPRTGRCLVQPTNSIRYFYWLVWKRDTREHFSKNAHFKFQQMFNLTTFRKKIFKQTNTATLAFSHTQKNYQRCVHVPLTEYETKIIEILQLLNIED